MPPCRERGRAAYWYYSSGELAALHLLVPEKILPYSVPDPQVGVSAPVPTEQVNYQTYIVRCGGYPRYRGVRNSLSSPRGDIMERI